MSPALAGGLLPTVSPGKSKDIILFPLNNLGTLVEYQLDHKCNSLFLNSHFYTVLFYIFMSVLHCFCYCTFLVSFFFFFFLVSFKIRKCESSKFVLIFQDCFGYLAYLRFYMNLRMASPFLKKRPWNFDRDCIESVNGSVLYCHFNCYMFRS